MYFDKLLSTELLYGIDKIKNKRFNTPIMINYAFIVVIVDPDKLSSLGLDLRLSEKVQTFLIYFSHIAKMDVIDLIHL